MPKRITIAFIGDVMLGRGVNEEIPTSLPEEFWGNVLPILRSADAVIANLECAITEHKIRWWKTPKVFYFRADPPSVEVLKTANIRCVTLANNHTLDYEEQGLIDTLRSLDNAGIARAGAGVNAVEAAQPVIFDVSDLKVGVLSFTDNEPPFAAGPDSPGTNYIEIGTNQTALDRIRDGVMQARWYGADLVVLSLHWGPNMVLRPPRLFQEFGLAAIDLGVDVVYGHSAHVFQGVQVPQDRLIMYDTGDFIDDYAVDPELRNDWSFIFLLDVDAEGPKRLRMLPVRLRYARVELAEGEEFQQIRDRMRMLCRELGTETIDTPEGLELTIRE